MRTASGRSARATRTGILVLSALALLMALLPAATATERDRVPPQEATPDAPAAPPSVPEKLTGSITYTYEKEGDHHVSTYHTLLQATVAIEVAYSFSNLGDLYYEGWSGSSGSFTLDQEVHYKDNCMRNVTTTGSGTAPPFEDFSLVARDSDAGFNVYIPGTKTTTEEPGNPSPSCTPDEPSEGVYWAEVACGGTPSWKPNGDLAIDFNDERSLGDQRWTCSGSVSGNADDEDDDPDEEDDLEVSVEPYDLEGNPLDKELTLDQNFIVDVTVENTTDGVLKDVEFAFDTALKIDERSPGGVIELSGPDHGLPSQLAAGEQQTFTFELTTVSEGIAAAHTKVTATNADGDDVESAESLKFDILESQVVTEELRRMIILDAIDKYFQRTFVNFYNALKERADRLKVALGDVISDEAKEAYFGPGGTLLTLFNERIEAARRAVPPEMVGVTTPNGEFKGHTVEELNAAYNGSFKKEVGKGVKEWVEGWKKLGKSAKKFAKDSYTESLLATYYAMGTATPEERAQFEVYAMTLLDEISKPQDNLYTQLERDTRDFVLDLADFGPSSQAAIERTVEDITLQSEDLQAQLAQESKWRENMLKLADTDPVRFQEEWAKRDAEIFNLPLPTILDTAFGGGVARIGGGVTKVVKIKVRGDGAAVIRGGEASGVIKPNGKVVKKPKTGITPADSPGMSGTDIAQLERTSDEFLRNVDDATVVRSSDHGNIYELPNTGGVPEITLDAKAGILGELESEYLKATGKNLELAEILKPSSALRKPGGIAKLELTSTKTGKTTMLDGGMPDAALAEANVWTSPTHPSKLSGFDDLSKSQQGKAVDEWKKANQRWDDYHNPAPGSKEEKLRQCIGQRSRVPLDDKPNEAGLQRYVTAEFEEVLVTQGDSQAKLIRVKHYEVEVFDHNSGKTVNRKTVVDNLPEGSPQTADADAVGVAKVVGTGPDGKPILEPLSRAEREFVMQRYIDKNIKARRSGLIPDAAEHGATLIMDDASAAAAGKLLPNYGVPFLPESVARRYLARIAPWVKGKAKISDAEMVEKMLKIIQSEGGFGQHAVVLTRDSRYLGALDVAAW